MQKPILAALALCLPALFACSSAPPPVTTVTIKEVELVKIAPPAHLTQNCYEPELQGHKWLDGIALSEARKLALYECNKQLEKLRADIATQLSTND
ncbi:MAG: Rz1-like lysis system protein LysC [Shewanella sp.]|uniref:Rz1-like lysis system protein LysC n=1 Tax=Shewanella sp. TaxID=50422 RepID=UPI003F400BE1